MICSRLTLLALASVLTAEAAFGQDANYDLGIPELRQLEPTLTGSGITVAQVEAQATGNYDFEVSPGSLNQPASKFIYISGSGTSTTYPNDVGNTSDHAHYVGENFYGDEVTSDPEGIAYGVSTIYNYEADYFVNTVIASGTFGAIPMEIVNQSFIVSTDTGTQAEVEQDYDNYAAKYGTLFISGAGNGGLVSAPASAYNGIGVGGIDNGADSSSGTYNGRSKPDIVATSDDPSSDTSYTTALVSGAATLLLQAAQLGDAGAGTAVRGLRRAGAEGAAAQRGDQAGRLEPHGHGAAGSELRSGSAECLQLIPQPGWGRAWNIRRNIGCGGLHQQRHDPAK